MYYITVKGSPRYKQISFEDLLFGNCDDTAPVSKNITGTVTRKYEEIPSKYNNSSALSNLASKIIRFHKSYKELIDADKSELYTTFYIPKKSGGYRRIDAPNNHLMNALRSLNDILSLDNSGYGAIKTYHTNAFAYIKGRSTLNAVRKHKMNKSNWYMKIDFSNFFGSITLEFLISMLSIIYPYSELMKHAEMKNQFEEVLSLCFLNGGLPQGTPISPFLTNLIMIPIDYEISNNIDSRFNDHFVYTRYADDIIISSVKKFDWKAVESFVIDECGKFNAPFQLNKSKTRFGSRAGHNFNLGLVTNKDNEITVGWREKKRLRASIDSFVKNYGNWDQTDAYRLMGNISYIKSIEPDYTKGVFEYYCKKYNADVMEMLKQKVSGKS